MYQDKPPTKSPPNNQRKANASPTDGQLSTTQEEYKNKEIPSVYIPSRAELSAYVTEAAIPIDPDDIYDYYEAVGWEINGKPVKDWKALCRRWKQYDEPKKESQEEHDAEVNRLLDILEKGGSIYDTTGSS